MAKIPTRKFLLTGFLAQMVDGSLGMGYGTISTTFLLANGVNPAIDEDMLAGPIDGTLQFVTDKTAALPSRPSPERHRATPIC